MRTKFLLLGVLFIFGASISVHAEAFSAYLSAAQEVPTNASTAKGFARVLVNPTTRAFTLTLTFSGLGSNQTASHIHGSSGLGVNSAVLFTIGSTGATSGTLTSSGTFTVQQYLDLRRHLFYVNVHSTNFSGGEIRGQLAQRRVVDSDGDGRTDPSVIRFPTGPPSPMTLYNNNTTTGFQAIGPFGDAQTDFPAPGDYDGDGLEDFTLYRAGATAGAQSFFYTLRSSNNVVDYVDWGVFGDQSISRDYDGDGKQDYAVFRPGAAAGQSAVWWIIYSSTFVRGAITWGTTGDGVNTFDTPVPGDYDGDGKFDVAVYRIAIAPANNYIVLRSSDQGVVFYTFGNFVTDYILPGDYDGDGITDYAVGRTGAAATNPMTWIVRSSVSPGTEFGGNFGISSDIPAQGDYDGDGRTDFAVYRRGALATSQSYFFSYNSLAGAISYMPWGLRPDFPVASYDSR